MASPGAMVWIVRPGVYGGRVLEHAAPAGLGGGAPRPRKLSDASTISTTPNMCAVSGSQRLEAVRRDVPPDRPQRRLSEAAGGVDVEAGRDDPGLDPGHPDERRRSTIPTPTMTRAVPVPSAADTAIASSSVGKASSASATRMITSSAQPPSITRQHANGNTNDGGDADRDEPSPRRDLPAEHQPRGHRGQADRYQASARARAVVKSRCSPAIQAVRRDDRREQRDQQA